MQAEAPSTLNQFGPSTLNPQPSTLFSIGQQMEAHRNRQAFFRLESDIRQAARDLGFSPAETDTLVNRARVVFVITDGEARPMQSGGTAPLRNSQVSLLTFDEWVRSSPFVPFVSPPSFPPFPPVKPFSLPPSV